MKLQTNAGFGFSMTGIQNLTETSYTLALIMLDLTGSVSGEEAEIKRMLEQIVADGKRAGWGKRVLISAMAFNTQIGVKELFGFDVPSAIDLSGVQINTTAATNLIDAMATGHDALEKAANELVGADFITNLLLIGTTDGEDNASRLTAQELAGKFAAARKNESFDSFKTILIGLRTGQQAQDSRYARKTVDQVLTDLTAAAQFDQYESAKQVKDGTYGKIGGFISQSISSSSQSLGSGSPSQNVNFTV